MFELDTEVREWRTRLERGSSLSARELDELEDHLRARADLELELNAGLAPARAFAIAREGLGQPKAISKEFARAGHPRWRRLLLAGWALYAVSFLLPVLAASGPAADYFTARGYELFVRIFQEGELGPPLVALLSNLPMLMTLPALWRLPRWRALWGLVGTVGLASLAFGVFTLASPPRLGADGLAGLGYLGAGYWAWSASFVCAASALRLRNRDRASANAKAEAA